MSDVLIQLRRAKRQNETRLDLSGKDLSSLPSELYGLNLESLNLADNQLVVLDERLTKLKNLKQLNLANNQLESLPECVLALPLIQLVIDKNPLRAPFDALLDKGNQVQPKLAQVLAACFGKKADAGEVRGEDLVSKLLVAQSQSKELESKLLLAQRQLEEVSQSTFQLRRESGLAVSTDLVLEVQQEHLKKGKQIGQGGFSIIYSGEYFGTAVCIKKVFNPKVTQQLLDDLSNQINMLAKFRHPNIILLLGICSAADNLSIVTELVERGSLFQLLHKRKAKLGEGLLRRVARETASVLAYLHAHRVVHRDIKSHNVMLKEDDSVRVIDFGLCKPIVTRQPGRAPQGPHAVQRHPHLHGPRTLRQTPLLRGGRRLRLRDHALGNVRGGGALRRAGAGGHKGPGRQGQFAAGAGLGAGRHPGPGERVPTAGPGEADLCLAAGRTTVVRTLNIMIETTKCPKCKSDNTIRFVLNRNQCIVPNCGFVEFSPITYHNENNNYEGEHAHESRAAGTLNEALRSGGIMLEFEGKNATEINRILNDHSDKHEKDFEDVSSKINKLIVKLRAVDAIKHNAIMKYHLLIKRVPKVREHLSAEQMAAYCVYWAYFEDGMFMMEDKVRKKAQIKERVWGDIKKKVMRYTTDTSLNLPKLKIEQHAEETAHNFALTPEQREVYISIISNIKSHKLCRGETLSTQLAAGLFVLVRAHEQLNKERTLKQIADLQGITEETIRRFITNNILPEKNLELLPEYFTKEQGRRPGFKLSQILLRDES